MAGVNKKLRMILDVPLKLTVELGRSRLPIHEILELTNGSILALEKLAGEPLDVLVNGKLIARGEAVVVNGNLGVRVTEIVAAAKDPHDLDEAG
jgi:flagellar motor switch protein FliN/FliY